MSLSSNTCLSKEAGQKTTLVCLVSLLNVRKNQAHIHIKALKIGSSMIFRGWSCLSNYLFLHPRSHLSAACMHACLLAVMCADPLTLEWVLYLEYGRSLGFSGHGRCLVSRRRQISAWAMWHAVSKRGRMCKRNWRVAINGLRLRRM